MGPAATRVPAGQSDTGVHEVWPALAAKALTPSQSAQTRSELAVGAVACAVPTGQTV